MEIGLNCGEMISIDGDMRGLRISCSGGRLWITQPGDSRDHILAAGEFFTVATKGRVVVTAYGEARLHLTDVSTKQVAARPWFSRTGSGLPLRLLGYSSS